MSQDSVHGKRKAPAPEEIKFIELKYGLYYSKAILWTKEVEVTVRACFQNLLFVLLFHNQETSNERTVEGSKVKKLTTVIRAHLEHTQIIAYQNVTTA